MEDDESSAKTIGPLPKWLWILLAWLLALLLLLLGYFFYQEIRRGKLAEAEKRRLAEKENACKIVLNDILKKMEAAQKAKRPAGMAASLGELRDSFRETSGIANGGCVELVDKYIAVTKLLTKKPDVSKIAQYEDLKHLAQKCTKCKKGFIICSECKGSKICIRCGGSGRYQVPLFEGGYRTAHCERTCSACIKPRRCRSCAGKSFHVDGKKCRKQLQIIQKSLQLRVDNFSLPREVAESKEAQTSADE